MSDKWDEFQISNPEESNVSVDNSNDKWASFQTGRKPAQLTAGDYGLLGGAGLAALGVAKWAAEPFMEKGKINKQLSPIRKDFGISKNIKALKLPDELQNILNQEYLSAEGGIIKDTSQNLAKNYSSWRNGAFVKYGETLDQIDTIINKNGLGVPISADSFKDDVLLKTAESLEKKGLLKEAKAIRQAGKLYKGGAPIQFSQAKQTVSNLTKSYPKIGRALVENFGDFMSTDPVVAKTPAGEMFKNLQNNYKIFKEADNLAGKLIDIETGELNTQKINTALNQYVKGKGNPQTAAFLNKMGENSKLTAGVPELSQQSKVLENISKKVTKIRQAKITTASLANQLEGVNSKIKTRVIAAGTTAALAGGNNLLQQFMRLPFGGKVVAALPILQGVGQASTAFDMWKLRNEPLQQYQRAMSGASFGLDGKPVPPMARTQEIGQELAQNPQAYENAIMTPETFNFLKLRGEAKKEKESWTSKDIRDLFKRKK